MWRSRIRKHGKDLLQRMQHLLYTEERKFAAICHQGDTISCCVLQRDACWEVAHLCVTEISSAEDGEPMRALTEKVHQVLGRWGMLELPMILVISDDGIVHAYDKVFPTMTEEALKVAVQWDATAALGIASEDVAIGYGVEDGTVRVAVVDRHVLDGYKRAFSGAGIALRDVVFVAERDAMEELSYGGSELFYKSMKCDVRTSASSLSTGIRLALLGVMIWQEGTAISFLSKSSKTKLFQWNRLAMILLLLAVGSSLFPIATTYVELHGVGAELREVDHRLTLLTEEVEQRERDREMETYMVQKNSTLIRLTQQHAPYRGLLIRLGAIDVQGIAMEEVRFDAEGTSTLRGRAENYERLSDYMREIATTGVAPCMEVSLQQAEQRKDETGIDFILTVQLPEEGARDEK